MTELNSELIDAALDVHNVILDLEATKRAHDEVPNRVNIALVKLRGAFADLQEVVTAPHSLPPHQSE